MLSFKDYISERQVDPVALGQRAAKIYGKKKSFGKWEKVQKHGHIPLSGFNGRKVSGASTRMMNVQDKLGDEHFESLHKQKKFAISDLHPTQKYVETHDVEKLKHKIGEKDPNKIHVVTHKGTHYIADGHHAVMAAKLRGDKHIEAKHINLDEIK